MTHPQRRAAGDLGSALRNERIESLDYGLGLLRDAWNSFDVARPAQPPISQDTYDLAAAPLPAEGIGVRAALESAASILDQSLAQSRPAYFGYIGSSGLESAVLADALAASYDVNMAGESAAALLVEQQVVRWMGEFAGYETTGGTITSGGLVSNLTALMAARTTALPESRVQGLAGVRPVVYTSADAHSSIERAVEILGIGRASLRSIGIDERRRMRADALAEAVRQDLAAGFTPVAVVATAGTTLTGAVDPLDQIADVCEEFGIWLHVDGAYGLPAASTALAGHLFAGLNRASSVTVDAHKWMFVPKACGILMLRDATALTRAFRHDASYMIEEEGYAHPVEGTLEYSRPFRALKLWMALRAHGAQAFREAITVNLELAQELMRAVQAHPRMELMLGQPDLSVVPFRHLPTRGDVNEHNRRLARALQEDARVYVTSAVMDGMTCLRPCVVNFRTQRSDIEALITRTDELGQALSAGS